MCAPTCMQVHEDYWNQRGLRVLNQEVFLVSNMGIRPRNKDDGILQNYRRYLCQFSYESNLWVPLKFPRSELSPQWKRPHRSLRLVSDISCNMRWLRIKRTSCLKISWSYDYNMQMHLLRHFVILLFLYLTIWALLLWPKKTLQNSAVSDGSWHRFFFFFFFCG